MESTELAVKQDQIQGLVIQTNEAITANKTSLSKAKQAGFALIDEIEQKGMSDEIDEKANNLLVKIRKTQAAMLERRKPVTQLFDQLKKVFTGFETELDPKTSGSVYYILQSHRDTYAADKAEKARKAEEERQRQLRIANEKTEVESKVKLALNEYFEAHLQSKIHILTDLFNNANLSNFKENTLEIKAFPVDYSRDHFNMFTKSVSVIYVDQNTVTSIVDESKSEEQFKLFAEVYWNKIDDLKLNLIDKLPGKLQELEAIAEAERNNAAEAERLKAEVAEREFAEKLKQQQEAEQRRIEAENKAASEKATSQMQNLFDATPTETVNTAQVRTGFEITVTHQKGWLEIFNFWWLKEGYDLPIDAIGRKSLDQMKTFCQNYAAKEGEQITSPFVKYKETFKAVAKA